MLKEDTLHNAACTLGFDLVIIPKAVYKWHHLVDPVVGTKWGHDGSQASSLTPTPPPSFMDLPHVTVTPFALPLP